MKSSDKIHGTIGWWVWILLAVGSYAMMRYFLPDFLFSKSYKEFGAVIKDMAPLVTMVFLLLGAFALYKDVPAEEEENKANGEHE